MNQTIPLRAIVVGVTTGFVTSLGLAREKPVATQANDSSATQRQQDSSKPADPAKPGPAHKLLEKRAGTWKMPYRIYSNPGQPPIELPATGELKMILGGRFLRQEMSGEGPWQGTAGLGVEGYDNVKKKYFFNWVDSNSTATLSFAGTADDAGKVITYTGEIDDATTGMKGIKVRVVVRLVSDDEHTFEFFQTPPGGKESKPFDITYTRN